MSYTIKTDASILHNIMLKDYKQVVQNPVLEQEVNKPDSLTFLLCPCNPSYNAIKSMKSQITAFDGGSEIFRGRVLETSDDYFKKRKVYCESELAYLMDSVQRPYEFSGDIPQYLSILLQNHNEQVKEEEKKFYLGQVTVTDPNNYIARSDSGYLSTYESIQKKLIETHGGYLRIRKDGNIRRLDYLKTLGRNTSQVIRFEENILDITRLIDASEIFTALIPLGNKVSDDPERRLTIASVNGGVDYLYNEEAVNRFGWIFKTNTWDDVTIPQNLIQKGKEFLQNGIFENTTIELTAVDLHLIHADIEMIRCGESVRVVSAPHGIDTYMMVSKKKTDLENPANSKLQLGHVCHCVTDTYKR